jgi:hypothetical protein
MSDINAIRRLLYSTGVGPTSLTGDTTVPSTTLYGVYTNSGATADIILTLPSAAVGAEFWVLKEERGYAFRVDCDFSQRFDDFPNGVDLALIDNGYAHIKCLKAGVWSVLSKRGLQLLGFTGYTPRNIYLATTGNDSNNGTAVGTPKLTLRGIQAIARPGDIVNVAAGTYSGAANEIRTANLPMGTEDARISFTCSTAFGARFPNIYLGYPAASFIQKYRWFLDWTNCVFVATSANDTTGENSIQAYDMRFFRCGFTGGSTVAGSNRHTCSVGGGNDYYRGAKNVLLEDCVAVGPGGRYKFLMYGAEDSIFRRCVARWDQGWDSDGSGIQASDFGLYDSSRCEAQNCISVDDLAPATYPGVYKGAFFMEQNYYETTDIAMRGCIAVNNQGSALQINSLTTNPVAEPSGDSTTIRRMRAKNWLVQDCAFAKVLHPSAHSTDAILIGIGPVDVENCTVADLNRAAGRAIYADVNTRYVTGSRVSNCVTAYGAAGGAAHVSVPTGVTTSGNLTYADLAAAATAGLDYLPRPTLASTIAGAYAGANILKRIGSPASLYGQPAFKQVGNGATSGDLWPFPYEADIKAFFVEFGGTARGWISTSDTLTEYIWGILGTAGPP